MSGRDGGPAAMECRPAPLSAVSGAPNPVPRGVIGAANVGWPGPSSASLALFECRPLHIGGQKVYQMYGVQPYHLLICDALGLNYAWYEAPTAHKNVKQTHTP